MAIAPSWPGHQAEAILADEKPKGQPSISRLPRRLTHPASSHPHGCRWQGGNLVDNYKGGRFNRPNDVICHSNGCIYFTDPDKRRAYHEREIPGPERDNNLWDACIYRLARGRARRRISRHSQFLLGTLP
jgi:hypothetical protein